MPSHVAKDKERVNFTITKDLKKRIEKQAELENRSMSNLINVALEYYLKKEGRQL